LAVVHELNGLDTTEVREVLLDQQGPTFWQENFLSKCMAVERSEWSDIKGVIWEHEVECEHKNLVTFEAIAA
jgi:hypothetical protein